VISQARRPLAVSPLHAVRPPEEIEINLPLANLALELREVPPYL
jgi:hypothetical protein